MKKDRKRYLRETKREIKRRGNHQRRQFFKEQLRINPDEAHLTDWVFEGKTKSESLNGSDLLGQTNLINNEEKS